MMWFNDLSIPEIQWVVRVWKVEVLWVDGVLIMQQTLSSQGTLELILCDEFNINHNSSFLCHLQSIAAHRDHFVLRRSILVSSCNGQV